MRTVDPEKHLAKRLGIIDAGLTCFAAHGYAGATTAVICREAGIGSGTFFHYFPTKASLLLGILELGTAEQREWFAAQEGRTDARQVLLDHVELFADQVTDPRMAGFVRAVGSVLGEPDVVGALDVDEQVTRGGLRTWLERAQAAGEVRTDVPPDRLASWVFLLLDGFLARMSVEEDFTSSRERAMLRDAVERLLA